MYIQSIFAVASLCGLVSAKSGFTALNDGTSGSTWYINNAKVYLDHDESDWRVVERLMQNNENISLSEWLALNPQFDVTESTTTYLEGAMVPHYDLSNSVDEFFQWFSNTWRVHRDKLWELPGGCWWSFGTASPQHQQEIACIGRESNNAVVAHLTRGETEDSEILSCPSTGYVCYRFVDRAGRHESIGSSWAVSDNKNMADSHHDSCGTFLVSWTNRIDCDPYKH